MPSPPERVRRIVNSAEEKPESNPAYSVISDSLPGKKKRDAQYDDHEKQEAAEQDVDLFAFAHNKRIRAAKNDVPGVRSSVLKLLPIAI